MMKQYKVLEDIDLFDYEADEHIEVEEGDIITILKHKGDKVLIGYQGKMYFQYMYSIEDKIKEV